MSTCPTSPDFWTRLITAAADRVSHQLLHARTQLRLRRGIQSHYILFSVLCYILFYHVQLYIILVYLVYRPRTFRSQTSDNMDRWRSRGGKSQRRARGRRKKMQVRKKIEKSWNTAFFQCFVNFVAPDGRKVGSLKRRVRSQLGRWKIARRCDNRSTFGSWDVEKVQHMSKSKWHKDHMFGPLLEVEMFKKCTPLWREAHF